jgi:mannose-6-phosphate isomerase-like protein (cupin superfamily)
VFKLKRLISTKSWYVSMKPTIVKAQNLNETLTPEHCFIAENYRSSQVSIARAKVKAGVTTVPHHLNGIDEIYIITQGTGTLHLGNQQPAQVNTGDVVFIPAGTSQSITNTGDSDLVFYCICNPCFSEDCYVSES